MLHQLLRHALLIAIIGTALSCTTVQRQQLYFAAAGIDDPDPTVKYYRVTIQARSTNAEMGYNAGFHDGQAVRALFGEVDKSTSGSSQLSRQAVWSQDTNMWEVGNDQVYTIIFGHDASAIAEQITAFA